VALARSRLERPQTPEGDPEAELRLYQGLMGRRLSDLIPRHVGLPGRRRRRGHFRIEGRTAFIDAETLRAVTGGIRQIVIVGAGYDGRALRFRSPGVRFFELDHPGTQADKRRRLEDLGVPLDHLTLRPVDLMADRVDAVLAAADQRDDEPSLFICEGLIRYISRGAVDRMLEGLRRRAAPGSRLVLTASESAAPAGRSARRWYLSVIGEPVRNRFDVGEIAEVLEQAGWTVVREVRRSRDDRGVRLLIAAEPIG
jgi:methyltransferase (TIGR00027 family)